MAMFVVVVDVEVLVVVVVDDDVVVVVNVEEVVIFLSYDWKGYLFRSNLFLALKVFSKNLLHMDLSSQRIYPYSYISCREYRWHDNSLKH